MVDIFDAATGAIIKQPQEEVTDDQEELIEEIERKEFPNLTFIALTATPSDGTLEKFGYKMWNDEKTQNDGLDSRFTMPDNSGQRKSDFSNSRLK